MKFVKITIIFLVFLKSVYSFEVTHRLKPKQSFEQSSLGGACTTIYKEVLFSKCNPALFPLMEKQSISVTAIAKADGDSIDNGESLIFDPITEDLIRKIFQEKNFNSFTLNSDITFATKFFEVAYSPYYLMADLYVYNPAFPEILLNLANHESLSLASGLKVIDKKMYNTNFEIYFGANVFYYKHTYANEKFSLLDLSTNDPIDLVKFKEVSGLSSDIGFFKKNDSKYFPNFSLVLKNIESKIKSDENKLSSATQQDTIFLFETHTLMGIGKGFQSNYGLFDFEYNIPLYGYLNRFEFEHSLLSFRYNMKLISLLSTAGLYYQSIGLRIDSRNFNIGISYAREKDAQQVQDDFDDSVYLGLDIIL